MLSKEVPMGLVTGDTLTALRGRFEFDPLDPVAVALTLSAPGQEVRWVFARDLLVAGVSSPAGDGDVRVRPGWRRGTRVVAFELGSTRSVFEAPRRALDEFLDDSSDLAAHAQGILRHSLDQELARITGSAHGA